MPISSPDDSRAGLVYRRRVRVRRLPAIHRLMVIRMCLAFLALVVAAALHDAFCHGTCVRVGRTGSETTQATAAGPCAKHVWLRSKLLVLEAQRIPPWCVEAVTVTEQDYSHRAISAGANGTRYCYRGSTLSPVLLSAPRGRHAQETCAGSVSNSCARRDPSASRFRTASRRVLTGLRTRKRPDEARGQTE